MKKIDARSERSRKALIAATIELMPTSPSITLAELAKHAGVARATIYRHFENKEELLLATGRECIYTLNGLLTPIALEPLTGRQAIEKGIQAYFSVLDKYYFLKYFWVELEKDNEIKVLVDAYYATLNGFVRRAIREEELRNDLSDRFITLALDSLLYAGWEIVSNSQMDQKQAINELSLLFFEGTARK